MNQIKPGTGMFTSDHLELLISFAQGPRQTRGFGSHKTIRIFELSNAGLVCGIPDSSVVEITDKGRLIVDHVVKNFNRQLELTS
jgi:hypothetical protein